jgi:hypothetical protein
MLKVPWMVLYAAEPGLSEPQSPSLQGVAKIAMIIRTGKMQAIVRFGGGVTVTS